MTCREAEQLVIPFIRDELTNDELIAFMDHVTYCECCKEELEIYFMVDVGLKQLERGSGAYDISGQLEATMEASEDRVMHVWRTRTMLYAIKTLSGIGLLVTLLLQLRIWWQQGIF